MTIKIELHTADGQVFHAVVGNHPIKGDLVESEHDGQFIIGDQGHEYHNYPYRMYKATLVNTPGKPSACARPLLNPLCSQEL